MINKKQNKDTADGSGIFVYIGPTIRGVVQNGSVFRGAEDKIKDKIAALVEDKEHVKRLIVRDVDLATAKAKLKKGGNSLSVAYHALLSAK